MISMMRVGEMGWDGYLQILMIGRRRRRRGGRRWGGLRTAWWWIVGFGWAGSLEVVQLGIVEMIWGIDDAVEDWNEEEYWKAGRVILIIQPVTPNPQIWSIYKSMQWWTAKMPQ
jgi:hypothetical protein